ncbi:MAG: DUF1289 domain-containing protein [Pseudomonadota bacterium]
MTRRRRRARPQFDTSVPSPCIAVCQLDAQSICVGCRRTQDEIRDWMILSREEKLAVLECVAARQRNAG